VGSGDFTVLEILAHSVHFPIVLVRLCVKQQFQSFREITITRSATDSRIANTIISVDGTERLNKDFRVCTLGDDGNACRLGIDFVRLVYDYERLAAAMTSEGLPDEFVETIRTGWWTTCNEILPAKERARGIY
jgi:hypothetical protein